MKFKIFDCITFFEENLHLQLRFNILNDLVDHFVICESKYGHDGIKKKINFNKKNYPKFKDKITHIVVEKFPNQIDRWGREEYQRNYLINGIENAHNEDLIIFSDSDEIPSPKAILDINFLKKYFIFVQTHYYYKFNVINVAERFWEGSRACKKRDLKSFSWLRTRVRKKNLKYPFWRLDKITSIKILENGGWHFAYFLTPEQIINKIKSAPHIEFANGKNLDISEIEYRIKNLKDPLGRNRKLEKLQLHHENELPKYILQNKKLFKNWFL